MTLITSEFLRQNMVAKIEADHEGKGLVLRPEIKQALLTVPRELFAPGESRERAYEHSLALVTKRRETGEALSSVSAAWLQAQMLGQALNALGSLKGCNVLEIGSGGYNAALLRELVGRGGSVTTVDIDEDVTHRAATCLEAAGYNDVIVRCADGNETVDPGNFQLIIVTAGAWDIPEAWFRQLREGAVLVVPLRMWGMTRSWALRSIGGALFSDSQMQCGFVPVTGTAEHQVKYTDIADGVHIRIDEGQTADWSAAGPLLSEPCEEASCGLALPPRSMLGNLDLWIACVAQRMNDEFALLTAQESAVESGIVAPSWIHGAPAVLRDHTLAYRSALKWDGDGPGRTFDLTARAHGKAAREEAERMISVMSDWVNAGKPAPRLRAYPAQTPDGKLPAGTVLDKQHARLVLDFPTP